MPTDRIALITGANQGVGKQVATELAAAGVTVLLGSRDLGRGEAAAAEIGSGVTALQIDVTDPVSITAAAAWIEQQHGRLDLLVNNAGISHTRGAGFTMADYLESAPPSVAPIEEMRAVWDVNVFGVLAVYQTMLPLLRRGTAPRIVNVTSALGSLTYNADPASPYRPTFGPTYASSKAALNAITLSMMIELESTDIKVNLVTPNYTSTALNNFEGEESIAEGSREVVRVALLGADGPTGTFTMADAVDLPW